VALPQLSKTACNRWGQAGNGDASSPYLHFSFVNLLQGGLHSGCQNINTKIENCLKQIL
jgi:hypothetical protein